MKYAEVAVNSPIARRRTFSYSIPSDLTVSVGQAVWVPFGPHTLQGIVISLSPVPSVESTKEIISLISSRPLLSPIQIKLASWLSQYYIAPLFDAIALMLPPGFERRIITFLQLSSGLPDGKDITPDETKVLGLLNSRSSVRLSEIEKNIGKKKANLIVKQLIQHGLLTKTSQLEEVKVKPKLTRYLKLEIDSNKVAEAAARLRSARASLQASAIEYLSQHDEPVSLAELRKTLSCPKSVIGALQKRGLISMTETQAMRDPLAHFRIAPELSPVLTSGQREAWQIIRQAVMADSDKRQSVFLLEGVTGSGKTEIYLRALEDVVSQGRKGICLVPEIALTPQAIERFAGRFPGRVAILHSGLSLGEQFDEWNRIQNGDCDLVIGPRSALFAPQPNLGLIILDEEHEWNYKQADKSPRYHAREVAIKLAELSGAPVILGSATPDVESFYRAQVGNYQLVELKDRITPRGISQLPDVEIVDMRTELKNGNRSLFSRSLNTLMSEVLSRGEQVILFLNRRGAANFVQCQVCGNALGCPRCLVSLIYHSEKGRLVCHHCNFSVIPPGICPQCSSPRLKYFGIGTQKVEEEAKRLFPAARIIRWDRDVTLKRRAHEEILTKFKAHEADVLIGTQMIAKGLDIPNVTLAGVISADTGLNLPDFRAGERTFQLVCQVAGRAGRGFVAGKVIVQTFCPEHYAIKTASRHDYHSFYAQEIDYRRKFGYPPFNQLVRLVFSHTNLDSCRNECQKMCKLLSAEKDRRGIFDLKFIGPAPTHIPRSRGHYQWQIILCGIDLSEFLSNITFPRGWIVDVDPVSVI
jgi:primosomal protein N' (replication factor Y)